MSGLFVPMNYMVVRRIGGDYVPIAVGTLDSCLEFIHSHEQDLPFLYLRKKL